MSYDLDAFDAEMFEEARSIMKERFSEMIDGYLEDAQMYIDYIKDGFAKQDNNLVAQYAHPLKSSSASLGVMSISDIAKDLEYGAKDAIAEGSDIASLNVLVGSLEEAFRRAEVRLKSAA